MILYISRENPHDVNTCTCISCLVQSKKLSLCSSKAFQNDVYPFDLYVFFIVRSLAKGPSSRATRALMAF